MKSVFDSFVNASVIVSGESEINGWFNGGKIIAGMAKGGGVFCPFLNPLRINACPASIYKLSTVPKLISINYNII